MPQYEELCESTWRALKQQQGYRNEWRVIDLSAKMPFRAGVYFPEKLEAILIGFPAGPVARSAALPNGRGFRVVPVNPETDDRVLWIALCRTSRGNEAIFRRMAGDILTVLGREVEINDRALLFFIRRIRMWQNFMEHIRNGRLTVEEQAGLCGELEILNELLDGEIPPFEAVKSWQGPLDGAQDFRFLSGGIEVKSVLSGEGSLIRISSAEQLDSTQVSPLFLAVCNFTKNPSGRSLNERIHSTLQRMEVDPDAVNLFSSLIRNFHIDWQEVPDSSIRLDLHSKVIFEVGEDFPSLTGRNMPSAVSDVQYSIDTSVLSPFKTELNTVISQIKGFQHGCTSEFFDRD